ncbi:MAG: polysaccharide pyruvyl transferase family protein [Clostridia bacterium]|nr:polysaccharide pyruvyl transferase family protein [Clostridia bacterium]
MKKVGILTFHRSINYGAFMQAYSLSKKIQKRFPDVTVEIIDYTSKIMDDHYVPKINLSTLRNYRGYFPKKKQYKMFKDTLDRLPLSEKRICNDGQTQHVLKAYEDDYDVFVVGSDAVWNWCKRGFPNPYLLNFEKDVKKLSYAASAYGMDESYIKAEEKKYFAASLERFDFIGVRDEYTAALVKSVSSAVSPQYTCDPTVFLDMDDVFAEIGLSKEEFRAKIYKKLNISEDKKIIGMMGVPFELAEKIADRFGGEYVLVNLYNYSRFVKTQLLDIDPFEWAAVFGLFDLTVTSFFHGTLLSLCNGTPVINYDFSDFSKKNEGKICDVMRRLDLSDCHFKSKNDFDLIIKKAEDVLCNRAAYSTKITENMSALADSSDKFFEKIGECLQ